MSASIPASLEKVAQVLREMEKPRPAGESEQRRAPRVPLVTRLIAYVPSRFELATVEIYSRDISVSGMGFLSRRPFQPGERLGIALKIEGLPPKLVLARVAYGSYMKGGLYRVGVEFQESMADPHGTALPPERWKLAHQRHTSARPQEPAEAGPPAESAAADAEAAP